MGCEGGVYGWRCSYLALVDPVHEQPQGVVPKIPRSRRRGGAFVDHQFASASNRLCAAFFPEVIAPAISDEHQSRRGKILT